MNYLKYSALVFLFNFLTGTMIVQAQNDKKVNVNKALKVGDRFIPPNSTLLMRGMSLTIDWKELEKKVVILDFFDTFCGTCIQTMPKLQKLQDKLKDKVQIITVGWQDKATLDKFYSTNEFLKENKVNLPVIYSDVYLKQLFPHQGVPHVVFLYGGKVQAIVMSDQITEENILKLHDIGTIDLPLKDDFGKGDLISKEIKDGAQIKEGVWISGYQNGVPAESIRIKKDSVTNMVKTSFYNVSIYNAILFNWAKIKRANYIPRLERLVLDVKNPDRYQDVFDIGESWLLQNALSYERLDKIQRPDSAQARLVLNDLHSFFGIRSYKEMREMECLIFRSCPVKPYSGTISNEKMTYANSSVLATMTDLSEIFPPVLDMVDSKEPILIGSYNDLEEFNAQLGAYGIEAVIGRGKLEVLVIEDVK